MRLSAVWITNHPPSVLCVIRPVKINVPEMIYNQSWTWIGFVHGLDWVVLDWVQFLETFYGLDWIGSRSRYFNAILIVTALPDCQCVQIFRLSFDVN